MKQLAAWHQTKVGLLTFGAIELALAYAFASLAIDRGSWWWYAIVLILLVGFCRNALRLLKKMMRRQRKP